MMVDDLERLRRLGVLTGVVEEALEELVAAAEALRGWRDDEALGIALAVLDDAVRAVFAAREELAAEEAAL
jgi:hypothetical protein